VIDRQVRIGRDTIIAPYTHILGHSTIGTGCHLGPQVVVQDSTLGDEVCVEPFCMLQHATVPACRRVASFSHILSS
jgi:bifunctional UDP-N-acetylglucosamine pyrophosphorylase/glucosamine-1-phosphate N-acetyltransferase